MEFKSFNGPTLLGQFSGDEEILMEMITIFEESWAELLNPIHHSIIDRDQDHLVINAHTLKGVLGNFYTFNGAELAREIELCGKHGKFDEASVLASKLDEEVKFFLDELHELKKVLQAFF